MLRNDVDERTKAGRTAMNESDEEMVEAQPRQLPPAPVMLGVGMAIIGLGILGWMIYRRRQQSRTLVQQLAERLPIALDDVREELRTQLQRVRSR
jgi:hypothetical protein